MTDRLEPLDEEHPIAAGVLALLGVALVIGVILGITALVGTQVLGLSGSASGGGPDGRATLYLPEPEKTQANTDPEITLAPGEETPDEGDQQPGQKSSDKEKKEKKKQNVISLSLAQSSVAPMEQIDLTGVYPGGEGAILQVQRFENGRWVDFPASPVSVSNQTFSTYVLTGISGVQRFRMLDTDSGRTSNEVKVTVG